MDYPITLLDESQIKFIGGINNKRQIQENTTIKSISRFTKTDPRILIFPSTRKGQTKKVLKTQTKENIIVDFCVEIIKNGGMISIPHSLNKNDIVQIIKEKLDE